MTEIASSSEKKDIQKLQRAIVDGLEDVKGQDLKVFDTEHLSSLFERVIIASGTSNRQTKALAASVRDKVREAGFPKPRIEGEANGEWIIVDCGAAVAHVMQPAIRQYYNLEEIWGGKPVRLKFGAPRPEMPKAAVAAKPASAAAKKSASGKAKAGVKGAKPAPVRRAKPPERPLAPPAPVLDQKPKKASVKRTSSAMDTGVKTAKPAARKAVFKPVPAAKPKAATRKKPAGKA